MTFDVLLLERGGDIAAPLLLLALAILMIAILIDDDDLPGPRLFRVPAKS